MQNLICFVWTLWLMMINGSISYSYLLLLKKSVFMTCYTEGWVEGWNWHEENSLITKSPDLEHYKTLQTPINHHKTIKPLQNLTKLIQNLTKPYKTLHDPTKPLQKWRWPYTKQDCKTVHRGAIYCSLVLDICIYKALFHQWGFCLVSSFDC